MTTDAWLRAGAADATPTRPRVRASVRKNVVRLNIVGSFSVPPSLGAPGSNRHRVFAAYRLTGFPQLPALERAVCVPRPNPNASVDGYAAGRRGDDRVEIELDDLGQLAARAATDGGRSSTSASASAAGAPRKPPNELSSLAAVHELVGVAVGQRRDPEVRAADQLCEDAARSEGDERPEDRVLHDAGEQLGAAARSSAAR